MSMEEEDAQMSVLGKNKALLRRENQANEKESLYDETYVYIYIYICICINTSKNQERFFFRQTFRSTVV